MPYPQHLVRQLVDLSLPVWFPRPDATVGRWEAASEWYVVAARWGDFVWNVSLSRFVLECGDRAVEAVRKGFSDGVSDPLFRREVLGERAAAVYEFCAYFGRLR